MDKIILFNPFPKQIEFIKAVFSGLFSFILYGGGIRGGKSFAGISALIMLCKLFPGSRWAIVRRDMPTIEKNVFPSWEKLCPDNFVKHDRKRSTTNPHVEFKNGSQVLFFAENYNRDKELDRFKGLEVNGFLAEEINELEEDTFNKMIERAGSYIIPIPKGKESIKQPKPMILATCNPSPGWVKKKVYTPWKEGILKATWHYIRATIFDNPYVPKEYLETLKTLPPYHYKVFVEGDWEFQLKKENAYWRAFEMDQHVHLNRLDPCLPVHLSVDSNVLPYISVSFWQLPTPGRAVQIGEIAAKDPDNTAQGAAGLVNKYLNELGHMDMIILHGDASAKASNTVDPEKRSFITLFEGKLKEEFVTSNKVSRSNPSVSLRGEFINAVYYGLVPGLSISIGEECKESINDYMVVQQDMNGGMLKKRITEKGLTYEPNGHFSDTKAYFLCDVWIQEYNRFKNAGSTHEFIIKINKNHNDM